MESLWGGRECEILAGVGMMVILVSFAQVRKEKLGDRITALHQLVSPFGKVYVIIIL